jgi:hypothetical protein
VRGEGTKATQRQAEPSTSQPDLMWQLAQHLSMLLQTNNKNSSRIANSLNSFQSNWILDSGATDHITGNKNLLHNYENWNKVQFVIVANGEKIKILGSGSIKLFSKNISNVLYVQHCSSNLLFINKLSQELKGYFFSGMGNEEKHW